MNITSVLLRNNRFHYFPCPIFEIPGLCFAGCFHETVAEKAQCTHKWRWGCKAYWGGLMQCIARSEPMQTKPWDYNIALPPTIYDTRHNVSSNQTGSGTAIYAYFWLPETLKECYNVKLAFWLTFSMFNTFICRIKSSTGRLVISGGENFSKSLKTADE